MSYERFIKDFRMCILGDYDTRSLRNGSDNPMYDILTLITKKVRRLWQKFM